MEGIPLEGLFVAAILITLLMGALAIGFLLRGASVVIRSAKDRRADIVTLQQEAVDVTRESIALQRETNRLLTELLARTATHIASTEGESAPKA